ncbi:hypothetical protein [Nonomuraea cavernae]|uniref:DUF4352 domain-containing protein n=1 Tax=Nonomuraea cavernae TaxID=2045107 RepID=A0A918DKS4_9ACTN|nr:hypothetical protein [Nonomuraea cavernae]MCA2185813.1 hypothetical protein [Nonomuraea cavernae]GGO69529.1 hypothetical protein GCM10012289_30890 [Nonomuraea cavernae]
MRKTIALAVAAIALTGCGMLPGQPGGGGEEKQAQQTAAKEDTPSTAADGRPAESASAPAEQQSAPPQGGQVIATLEAKASSGGQSGTARVDITALKRQGRTVSLNWTITSVKGSVNVHNGLGTGVFDYSVAAVSLIDPVNAKRYRVARNGSGSEAKCVCSGTQGQFLKDGEASTLYAVFAAPPADITKINIEMPMLGVLTDVPIS